MDKSHMIQKVILFIGLLTILMILIVQLPFELAIVFRFGYMKGLISLFLTYSLVLLLTLLIFKTKNKTVLILITIFGITKIMAFDYYTFIYLDQIDFISIIQLYSISQIPWTSQMTIILRYLYATGLLFSIVSSIYLKKNETSQIKMHV